ncbi:hypothetical protein GCM10020255_085920 [Rhodococcus baikonurensis]
MTRYDDLSASEFAQGFPTEDDVVVPSLGVYYDLLDNERGPCNELRIISKVVQISVHGGQVPAAQSHSGVDQA